MFTQPRYYGQHGDDYLLWHLFSDKEKGFFVDVGAFDGIHLSNSYSFELAGWNGICVEAIPDMFNRCQYSRPHTLCIEAACVGSEELHKVNFVMEKLGLLSGIGVNTNEDDIRRRYESRGINFDGFEEISVTARTLNSILAEYMPPDQGIDFVSIDVEGGELDVLKGFDIKKYTPRCIVVEANDEDHYRALAHYLGDGENYILARKLGCNLFFARDKKDAAILKKTSINCQIEPTAHPLGEEYTLRDHVDGKNIQSPPSIIRRLFNRSLKFGTRKQ